MKLDSYLPRPLRRLFENIHLRDIATTALYVAGPPLLNFAGVLGSALFVYYGKTPDPVPFDQLLKQIDFQRGVTGLAIVSPFFSLLGLSALRDRKYTSNI